MNIKIRPSDNEGKQSNCFCRECKRTTNHWIRKEFCFIQDNSDEEQYFGEVDYTAQILQCCGCNTITFYLLWQDVSYGREGSYTSEMFPPNTQSPDIGTLCNYYLSSTILPHGIETVYSETLKAINSGMFVLATMGIRTIIQAICNEKKIKPTRTTLGDLITALHEQQLVTLAGKKMLDALRNFGNDAAHEAKPMQRDQLISALSVIEHLLRELYILPSKAKRDLGVSTEFEADKLDEKQEASRTDTTPSETGTPEPGGSAIT